jgi:hypothetical protein
LTRAVAFAFLALVPLGGCLGPPRQTFDVTRAVGAPTRLASGGTENEDPTVIRTSDGRFRVVWWSKRNGEVDLYTRTSDDGEVWNDEQAITSDPAEDYYPSLTQTRDGTLHLAWFRFDRPTVRKDIWYTRSTDGRTWSEPVRMTTAGLDWAPAIYEDGFGVLWIVWSSGRSGNRELYAVRSGDGGRTWSKAFRLTSSPEEDDFPSVLVRPNGERVLAWTRYRHGSPVDDYYRDASAEVVTATSRDGLQWSTPVTWSPPDPDDRYLDLLPHLFRDTAGTRVFLAWTSTRPAQSGDILVRDLSSTSSEIRQLTGSRDSNYDAKIVAGSSPGAYLLLWISGRPGAMHVFAGMISL